jgi:hypothetical protein
MRSFKVGAYFKAGLSIKGEQDKGDKEAGLWI